MSDIFCTRCLTYSEGHCPEHDPLVLTEEKVNRRDAEAKAAWPERFIPLSIVLRWLREAAEHARRDATGGQP